MRKRTIRRRLRKNQFDEKHINDIFEKMYGIRDKETLSGEGQWLWIKAVRKAFRDQAKENKKAGIKSFVKPIKPTFTESWEDFGEAWKEFIESVKEVFMGGNNGND